MSDLHIGPRVDDGYLLRSFQRVKDLALEFVVRPEVTVFWTEGV